MIRRLRARIAHALDRRFAGISSQIDELRGSITQEQLERRTDHEEVRLALEDLRSSVDGPIHAMLRALATEQTTNRRRLFELREDSDYDPSFTEPDPLVTICVAARAERVDVLVERSLPSALAQTYANFEVVVVGDVGGPDMRAAVENLGDERIHFTDLTHRVVHPDPHRQWLTGTIMPRNEAHRRARGRWIADLDDDDALRPDAVEQLVALAQSERAEVAYGKLEQHEPDGGRSTIGGFPPGPIESDWKERGLQWQRWQGSASTGAVFHAGLRMFAREHIAAELAIPGDFFRLERMVRAGVRFAMLDRITYDYYPAKLWSAQPP